MIAHPPSAYIVPADPVGPDAALDRADACERLARSTEAAAWQALRDGDDDTAAELEAIARDLRGSAGMMRRGGGR